MFTNFSNESSSLQNATCNAHLDDFFPVKIVRIILYSVILVFSLVGNALIITIVRKREELRNTINYFIVNMAVSDFVYPLTVIPVQLTQLATSSCQWRIAGTAGVVFCKLIKFLEDVSISVSIQSLVWIAVDRFVAVVLPMKVHFISSRLRAFLITSTWVLAIAGNCLDLYVYELIDKREETICARFYNNTFLIQTYARVRTILFVIAPLVVMTTLYCGIGVTLRKQDKALLRRTVRQKYQRKQRAFRMSFCIMVAFYFCFVPMLLAFLIWQYGIAVSCLFLKTLGFLGPSALYFSSMINPIICMTFIQSYRCGLKGILNTCWSKLLTTNNKRTGEHVEINFQEIKITAIEYCSQDIHTTVPTAEETLC